jgi:hypothetical protein
LFLLCNSALIRRSHFRMTNVFPGGITSLTASGNSGGAFRRWGVGSFVDIFPYNRKNVFVFSSKQHARKGPHGYHEYHWIEQQEFILVAIERDGYQSLRHQPEATPRSGVPKWTPVGLQYRAKKSFRLGKSLRGLVGTPGFEPGTSCTPSKKYQSLRSALH